MKVYSIRLPELLVGEIRLSSSDDISTFIRNAVEEKLWKQQRKNEKFDKLVGKLDMFDFEKLDHLSMTSRLIHKEILKQNAALKLVLLRVSKSAELVNALTNDFDTTEILQFADERCQQEIKELEL